MHADKRMTGMPRDDAKHNKQITGKAGKHKINGPHHRTVFFMWFPLQTN